MHELGRFYAELVRSWHQKIGMHRRSDPNYTALVELAGTFDLNNPELQHKIAQLQVSGAWEWAYPEQVSDELWELWKDSLKEPPPKPRTLGETARLILNPIKPKSEKLIEFSDLEDLLDKARSAYEAFRREESRGIGGAAFLLSCSIERSRSLEHDHQVRLFFPEDLGIEVAPRGRAGDLLEHLRDGSLELTDVVGLSE